MAKRKAFEPKESALDAKLAQTDAAAIAEADAIDEPRILHVSGKPIPPEFAHAITYQMTDEGQAEARAKDAKGPKPSGVQVISGEFERQLERKADAQTWDSFDPLREAVDSVREPGMAYRFLADRSVKRRGRRGWEPVIVKGDPVKVADMVLAKMPEAKAERRNAHYREIGNERLRDSAAQYEQDQAKAIRDANVKGFAPLRAGEVVADNHDHPGMVIEAGIRTTRGTGGEVAL